MKAFADLYRNLDETTKTNAKVDALVAFFSASEPADAAWAVFLLTGRKLKRLVVTPRLREWAAAEASLPDWLFSESYDAVGDLAETIALVLPAPVAVQDLPLAAWIEERIRPLAAMEEARQREAVLAAWRTLTSEERFVYNKIITGSFRVGVSRELVIRALAAVGNTTAPLVAHRLMGDWDPTPAWYAALFAPADASADRSRPYPFCLAHPLEGGADALENLDDYLVEWKWDGIRCQLIRRGGKTYVWSRGEELITDRFPEIAGVGDDLPDGTVLDGEILAFRDGRPLPFLELQKRIGRKTVGKKLLADVPVVLVAFDVLERGGEDLRERPLSERREALAALVEEHAVRSRPVPLLPDVDPALATDGDAAPRTDSRLLLATAHLGLDGEGVARLREAARENGTEGLMIKRLDSPYQTGRKRGAWWKWKVDPYTVDAVLINAQRGSGRRASLYSDYTFAVWDEGKLVPFAKAYSGLTDEEMRRVDAFVRKHTRERFGPVRSVEPQLVMELGFEGLQLSPRHKSGVAVRFPRILRWRHDKRPEDADSLALIREWLVASVSDR